MQEVIVMDKIIIYFVDNSVEQWVKNDSATLELVDNTNGHGHYEMEKQDDKTWKVEVDEAAQNITFNRLNEDGTVQWNSWSAGGRGDCNVYYSGGAEFGHWGKLEEDV